MGNLSPPPSPDPTDPGSRWPPLVLYTKAGCGLCEELAHKLEQIPGLWQRVESRDITTRPDWWDRYALEVPVLCCVWGNTERPVPRTSPRASVDQVQQNLERFLGQLQQVD